jgi:hypothetical protein
LGLDWYDFKWRFYEPALGRFFTQDRLAEKFAYMSPYQFCSNSPIWMKELDGLEGIKYTDADGVKTIEKNVVVLTEQNKPIPKGASSKQVKKINRQNKNINVRNQNKVNRVSSQLNQAFGNAKDSKGNKVNFSFNISTQQVAHPNEPGLATAMNIGKSNGVVSSTLAIDGKTNLKASAAVITNIDAAIPGNTQGNIQVIAGSEFDNSIAHEVGHTLLITGESEDTYPNGSLMNYPARGLVSGEEVDKMWDQAYEK